MTVILLLIVVAVLQGLTLAAVLRARPQSPAEQREALQTAMGPVETALRDEFERSRREAATAGRETRSELEQRLDGVRDTLGRALSEFRAEFTAQFTSQAEGVDRRLGELREVLAKRLQAMQEGNEAKLEAVRTTVSKSLTEYRQELLVQFKAQSETLDRSLAETRSTVERHLEALRAGNEAKLEEMRRTVDEKLQDTLEKRLGESFVLVSDRLEKVGEGLGEMRNLAGSVLDLSRILSNVKDRGTFGEVQLGNLLDQTLGERQYEVNAAVSPDRPNERVEYAVRLPSRERPGHFVLLPIDAKFPLEDYRRLAAAQQEANAEAAEAAAKALMATVVQEARKIRDKYVCPPETTDFAFMFLPTEGLYAEVASRPDVMDKLREFRVVPAGPINLYALLDIVGMVYRFLAVQEQAGKVWELLGAVKSEFGKFGEVLTSVKRKIQSASSEFDKVDVRTRAIARRLREVQELPPDRTAEVLVLEAAAATEPE